MSSPSSNKENEEDCLSTPGYSKYSKTILTDKTCAQTYRHFGIPPVNTEETFGPPITFIFVSVRKDENNVPLKVLQDQIATSLRVLYLNGVILKAKETSATYPVIYFTQGKASKISQQEYTIDGCTSCEGIYKEVRTIKPVSEPQQVILPQQWKNYILLAFKRPQNCFTQTMIDTWKDWTGARYIYINLPDEMGLTQITLYQRQNISPDDANVYSFTHLVVAECCTINTEEKKIALMDFIQRLRVERISGYISVYEVEAEY